MEIPQKEQEPIKPEQEKVVISLPEDEKSVAQLKDKLQEYIRRREKDQVVIDDPYKAPEQKNRAIKDSWDAYYKGTVLGRLLSQKSVDSEALENELEQSNGGSFSKTSFKSAVKIIKDYAETGGKNNIGLREVGEKSGPDVPQKKSNIIEARNTGHVLTEEDIKERQNIREWLKNPEEIKRTAEQAQQRVKEEEQKDKEIQEHKIEDALKILSSPEIINFKPEEIEKAFKNITGKDLIAEREKMAEESMGARKMRIIRGGKAVEEYRKQVIKKEKERIIGEEHSKALSVFWERNSNIEEASREQYLISIKNKLGLNPADNVVLDKLINDGYEVEKARIGWFSGIVKIPKAGGKMVLVCDSRATLSQQTAKELNFEVSAQAQLRADLKIIEGKKRLWAERIACTKNIIEQTVEKYNLEQQKKQEAKQQALIGQQRREQEEAAEKQKTERNKEELFEKPKRKKLSKKVAVIKRKKRK